MIEFILNEKLIKTKSAEGMSLADFIRYKHKLKGTKLGCREGDCGACTVLAGELINDKIKYNSLTSCITPLKYAHGKHIVTIEGINNEDLNAIQSHIHEHAATQCGFCTPGFVMSLTGFSINTKIAKYTDGIKSVAGNICRCTGYKSIEKTIFDINESLKGKPENNQINWLIENNYLPKYFNSIPEKLKKINPKMNNVLGKIVGGGTDLYVQNADMMSLEKVKFINPTNKSKNITVAGNKATIHASTTVSEIIESKELKKIFPKLEKQLLLISSEQIRNTATIAGNFVNASPIGDMTIIFIALNSKITISTDNSSRNIFLKDFYKGYKNIDLLENEFIENLTFKIPENEFKFNFEKVSKRKYLDIASVNTAISINISDDFIKEIHISGGGLAPIPIYFAKASEFLNGKKVDQKIIKKASQILLSEVSPISDVRGSAEYKKLLLKQLFYAHFIELFSLRIEL